MFPSVAVVGATGAVGEIMRLVLLERAFELRAVKFLASERSAGKSIEFKGKVLTSSSRSDPEAFVGVDIVLSSTPASASRESSVMAVKRRGPSSSTHSLRAWTRRCRWSFPK